MKKLRWLLICYWIIPIIIYAQHTPFDITVRQFNLPGSFNRDLLEVARDDEGFIWFINNEGLWRFDGSDVKRIENEKLKLSQNLSSCTLYCYTHFLVLCLSNGEIHVYNKLTDSCNVYRIHDVITNLARQPDGKALLFTTSGSAWTISYDGVPKQSLDLKQCRSWTNTMSLRRAIIDHDGTIYLCLQDKIGILLRDSIVWSRVINEDISKKNGDYDIADCAATSQFIAVQYINDQLALYAKKTLAPIAFFSKQVSAACIAVNDRLVLVPNSDTVQIPASMLPFFYIKKGSFPGFTKVLNVLTENNKPWIMGTTAGIFELTPHASNENSYYDQQKAVAFFGDKSIRSVFAIDHKLYVGTYSGLFVCSADTIKLIPGGWAYTMGQESPHNLLIGTEGGSGFAMLDSRTDSFVTLTKSNVSADIYTTALFKDGDDWLTGNYKNISRLSNQHGTWSAKPIKCDSSLGTFRQITRINGQVFIACRQGVFKIDARDELHKVYPRNGTLLIYAMQEVPGGIWLGTHGKGLIKIDYAGNELQQLGFNDGLASSFVYSIGLIDNLLVAGTGAGASTFDISGAALPVHPHIDPENNGLLAQECNHSALYYDSTSRNIIIGGVKGLIFLSRHDFPAQTDNGQAPIILSYVKMGSHETNTASANLFAYAEREIRAKADDRSLTLKFAVPGDAEQEDALFRIKELSEKWQRLKIGQELNFYALPHGKYTLQARLPFSTKESQWFSKPLIIEPAFYQTTWFYVLSVLATIAVFYLLWRAEITKITREQKLRTTIASDLHDDIGSTLNSISVYTEIAKRQLSRDNEKTNLLLDKMGTASRDMIDRMSDIVWTINPRNDDFEQVLKRMHFFAGELLSGRNILLHFNVDEKVSKLKLKMQERKNIYLIYKEAIHNAYKYSGATEVSVNIKRTGDKLHMVIADNGAGFDSHEQVGKGNGLINMKQRSNEINAAFSIKTNPEGGTSIDLTM